MSSPSNASGISPSAPAAEIPPEFAATAPVTPASAEPSIVWDLETIEIPTHGTFIVLGTMEKIVFVALRDKWRKLYPTTLRFAWKGDDHAGVGLVRDERLQQFTDYLHCIAALQVYADHRGHLPLRVIYFLWRDGDDLEQAYPPEFCQRMREYRATCEAELEPLRAFMREMDKNSADGGP